MSGDKTQTTNAMSTQHKHAVSPEDWAFDIEQTALNDAIADVANDETEAETARELLNDWISDIRRDEVNSTDEAAAYYNAVYSAICHEIRILDSRYDDGDAQAEAYADFRRAAFR